MSRTARRWTIAAGIVVVVVVVVASALFIVARGSFPKTRGTVTAQGLQAPVEVLRDANGVPHITAATMHDLYFAQGFVTAQDRAWQMEFWRRLGQGRLAELFGKTALSTDIYIRTLGFRRAAQKDLDAMDAETRTVLQDYADGVNAYILTRPPAQLSLEFTLLQLQKVPFTIEPWSPLDSLTWLKLMSQNLGANMASELYTVDLVQAMGLSLTKTFFGTYRYGQVPVIVADNELPASLLKSGKAAITKITSQASPVLDGLTRDQVAALAGVSTRVVGGYGPDLLIGRGTGPGVGSNNWVIAGSRTASGKPILANDPHLKIQMPSIWYEVDLTCTGQGADVGKNAGGPYHVRGFSFAGTPAVVIGHNDRIAWGVTNLNPDVQDTYVEKINPENPNQYEVNGKWVAMTVRREEIKVLEQDEPKVILVRETRHGPIITDEGVSPAYRSYGVVTGRAASLSLEVKALSVRWTALQPNATFKAVVGIDKARNWTEFRDALRSWDIPSQNFVYADVDGNIGYQAPGLVPIRRNGDGTIPSPGWTDDYEWTGFIPFDQLPSLYNPAKGYVVTANNAVISPNYRNFISVSWDHGYRASRIAEMIEKAPEKITVAYVQSMQADTLNISARELLPFLKGLALKDDAARARDILMAWDQRMDAKSSGAAVFGYFWQALLEEVFKAKVPAALWESQAILDDNSRYMNTVFELMADPTNAFWDNPTTLDTRETRDDALATALEKGAKSGIKALGKNMSRWTWGAVHRSLFRNQTFGDSGIGLIEGIFNRGPVPVGGGMQQVVSSDWNPGKPFAADYISSMRQVIDLSNLGASLVMNATGQSGHAYNRHYDDMIPSWAAVKYHAEYWTPDDLKASRTDRLVLNPAK
jgi:penicillin G amidase